MQQFFVSGHIRPATLLRLAKKLIEINQPLQAGRVLQFLLKQNPGNHAALAELIRIDLMMQRTTTVLTQSQTMVENKTMPFELITYLSADHQLFHPGSSELVNEIMETVTPSKKKLLLEVL